MEKVFHGDAHSADAFVRENGTSYDEVRERWRPGDSVAFLAHGLWLASQRRHTTARNRSARTRIPSHERDTEENAIPLLITRQSRNRQSNETG